MSEDERDVNPPEPRDSYEPDYDAINDEIWLRKQEEQEEREQDES
tara:strand:- start:263 stop:397 length:135 start_codon:yes stop_codon:yes gene_type:complete